MWRRSEKNRSSARSFYFFTKKRFKLLCRPAVLNLNPFQLRQDRDQHRENAGGSADDIGDRLSEEYAVGSHMHGVGEKVGQRYDDEYFAEQGEEDRKDLLVQGFKYRLTDVLEVHKDKSCKIHVQRRNRILDQRRVRAENTDQRFRDENDHTPHDGRVAENKETHDQNGFPHASRSAGTVVVAQDWGGSLYHGVDRSLNKLAHTGDDGHDGDIDITAGDGKNIVAADRYETVGELHDKSGCTEAEDIFRVSGTFRDLILMKEPQLQLGFFREEKHDEGGRQALGDHGGDGRAADAESEGKNKERIKHQVRSGTDCDG